MSNNINRKALFERAVNLFREITTLEQDLEALKEEFTQTKEFTNPKGLEKDVVKTAVKAAEHFVRDSLHKEEEKIEKLKQFVEEYYELTE